MSWRCQTQPITRVNFDHTITFGVTRSQWVKDGMQVTLNGSQAFYVVMTRRQNGWYILNYQKALFHDIKIWNLLFWIRADCNNLCRKNVCQSGTMQNSSTFPKILERINCHTCFATAHLLVHTRSIYHLFQSNILGRSFRCRCFSLLIMTHNTVCIMRVYHELQISYKQPVPNSLLELNDLVMAITERVTISQKVTSATNTVWQPNPQYKHKGQMDALLASFGQHALTFKHQWKYIQNRMFK